MRRMMSPQRPRSKERGAVAVVTAAVVAVVAMAALAISVDIGRITWERGQTQNAADASVMALADLCAGNPSACFAGNPEIANRLKPLLNGNSTEDDLGQLAQAPDSAYAFGYCGRGQNREPSGLEQCIAQGSSAWTNTRQCPPLSDWLTTGDGVKIPYVEAYAKTLTASGDGFLPSIFEPDTKSTQVTCARAAWGPPNSYSGTIPFVISACEWQGFMDTNKDGKVDDSDLGYEPKPVGAWPGYGGSTQPAWPTPARERVIYIFDGKSASPCSYNGKDTAGGFGWVIPDTTTCEATVSSDGWVPISTGKPIDNTCKNLLDTFRGTVVALPVFDCLVKDPSVPPSGPITGYPCTVDGTGGAKTYYHIKGWAKFYVSGFNMPSKSANSFVKTPPAPPCSNPDACISGWFVEGQLSGKPGSTVGPPDGSNDFGAYQVVPAG